MIITRIYAFGRKASREICIQIQEVFRLSWCLVANL